MTDDQIRALKEKHGEKLKVIPVPATEFDAETEIVIKRPSRGEYKRFRTMLFDDAQKADAVETLAKNCVVYPENFAALLEDRPALADLVGGKAAEFAGAEGKIDAKKL